jgi:hypothetical protein
MQTLFFVLVAAVVVIAVIDAFARRPTRPFTYDWPYRTPPYYVCSKCGVANCKLWRPIHSDSNLLCAVCACREHDVDLESLDERGYTDSLYRYMGRTDQLGDMLPAVPVAHDGEQVYFYGYCSVPQTGCDWWYGLPSLPPVKYEHLLAPERT